MDLTELYEEHRSFIEGCAKKTARRYRCGNVIEDLGSAGTIAFLEHIGGYDEKRGVTLTAFLRLHIMGAIRREAEKNFSAFSLSRREFEQIRKAEALAQARGVSLDEPAEDGGGELYDSIPDLQTSVDEQVYIKICIEYLQTAFETLSFKEREILGGAFGVYGHKEQTLAEIGEEFQMKESAALKAKDKALEKLRKLCLEGNWGCWRVAWRSVRAAIWSASRDIGREPRLNCPVQILAERVMFYLQNALAGDLSGDEARQKIRILALLTVLEQLYFKAPEPTLRTFIRLTRLGYAPLAAMEQIAAVLLEEVYFILKYNSGYNAKRYARKLRQLL